MTTTGRKHGCIFALTIGTCWGTNCHLGVYSPSEKLFGGHVCGQLITCVLVWLCEYARRFHFGPLAFLAFDSDQNPLEGSHWEGKWPPHWPSGARCTVPRSSREALGFERQFTRMTVK